MSRSVPFLTLSLVLLLAACGDAEPAGDASAEAPAAATAGVSAAEASAAGPVLESVTAEELLAQVRDADADLVVVNFWASWCLPCREEFPAFVRLRDEAEDVEVHFVSVDYEEDITFAQDFLDEFGVQRSYLREGKDAPFIDGINPEWTGSLPATAIYDQSGNRVAFWEGAVEYEDLVSRVEEARRAS